MEFATSNLLLRTGDCLRLIVLGLQMEVDFLMMLFENVLKNELSSLAK